MVAIENFMVAWRCGCIGRKGVFAGNCRVIVFQVAVQEYARRAILKHKCSTKISSPAQALESEDLESVDFREVGDDGGEGSRCRRENRPDRPW